jgi:uncharacterized protein
MHATFFDLHDIASQPWKNGAGRTREIASAPSADGAEGFDWRFSVAEVEHAAPFSQFPGVDRCIVLLRGAGLRLHGGDGAVDHRLDTVGEPFHFSGDLALTGTPIAGASSDFNVMTRRGLWRAEVGVYHAGFAVHPTEVTLLLCCEGEWSTSAVAAPLLQAQQGLLLREADDLLHCAPLSGAADASLLVARLCHDRAP